jgi:mono/diheme cytochrome c family protein
MQEHTMMSRQFHTIGFVFSLLMLAYPMWGFGQEYLGNPQQGKGLYEKHCALCHGIQGAGDGPDAQFLTVPPTDFHSLESRSKTDWDLMTIITSGVTFSPMHGWADRLIEKERWDVLRYIRLLAPFNPVARYQPLPTLPNV